MPETENNPILVDKVRELQRQLYVCAKQSRTRRFHALYDRIHRSDVLWRAWMRVRSNRGAAGGDETTLRSIEEQGVTQFLEGIQADLTAGQYRPSAVRRQYIGKDDGKQRPLGIPTVRDRGVGEGGGGGLGRWRARVGGGWLQSGRAACRRGARRGGGGGEEAGQVGRKN